MVGEEVWVTISVPVHPKVVRWGWGQGSVQDTPVFPLQPWQTILCTGAPSLFQWREIVMLRINTDILDNGMISVQHGELNVPGSVTMKSRLQPAHTFIKSASTLYPYTVDFTPSHLHCTIKWCNHLPDCRPQTFNQSVHGGVSAIVPIDRFRNLLCRSSRGSIRAQVTLKGGFKNICSVNLHQYHWLYL